VTVGLLQAGVANNVISNSAYMELSIRSFSTQVRQQLQERIEALVHAQAVSYGATAEIDYMAGYPVIDNDDAETEFALQVARELVGDEQVIAHADQLMSSEDFAYMLEQRPGCFLRLGNGVGEDGCMVHNPAYDFNDKNLPIGAAYWARLVERYLN
jgi:hippurate hydrolase